MARVLVSNLHAAPERFETRPHSFAIALGSFGDLDRTSLPFTLQTAWEDDAAGTGRRECSPGLSYWAAKSLSNDRKGLEAIKTSNLKTPTYGSSAMKDVFRFWSRTAARLFAI